MGFLESDEKLRFDQEGLDLWRNLRTEVGASCRIVYQTKLTLDGNLGPERCYF